MTEREDLVERVARAIRVVNISSSGVPAYLGDFDVLKTMARAAIAECEKDRADLTSVICDRDQTVDRLERELAEEKKQHYGTAELAHEFQAQCAAMRAALENAYELIRKEHAHADDGSGDVFDCRVRPVVAAIASALSPDAGRKVLDVVRAFSDLCADVRERYKILPNERFKCPIMQRGADALSALGWEPYR